MMMGTLLISGLVFVSITAAILGVGLMLQGNKNTEIEKRLATLTCGPTTGSKLYQEVQLYPCSTNARLQ